MIKSITQSNFMITTINKDFVVGACWRPKATYSNLPWKLTKIFEAQDGEQVFRLEKYQGGRNSPALLTKKKLLQNFTKYDNNN